MMNIDAALHDIRSQLPASTKLLAVSKFQPLEKIQAAYDCGQRLFGESRAQELKEKQQTLPKDIEWHFIGHLQKNKIKYIAPFVSLIHSVDSAALLSEIDKEAAKCGRCIDCLLQVHIATEESKFGFSPAECMDYLEQGHWKNYRHVRLCGLMGMATFTDQTEQIRQEFSTLKQCFDQAKLHYFSHEDSFCELSMGMSEDFPLALEYGSTLVRVGSAIFGDRQ